jgi:hypothetical protein
MKIYAMAVLLAVGLNVQAAMAQSKQVVLITPDEAKLEATLDSDLTFRAGISRGPSITVVSPKASETSLQSPIRLQLKFEGRGGARIDADSLKLIYVKKQALDLTDRVKAFVNPAGIDVPEATVPPGTHTLRAEIKDKENRSGSVTFTIKVAN